MQMGMTTEEKDVSLARIIEEHYITQKHNPTCVPVEHLQAKGFDISDSQNALWRLKERGIIKDYERGWGFLEKQEDGKTIFIITREEEPDDDSDDFEAYKIEIIPKRLAQMVGIHPEASKPGDVVILRLSKRGDLFREPKEKFCHEMQGKAIPLKILKYFINNPNEDYELSTKDIALDLDMEPQRLRNEINKIRDSVKNSLGLKIDLFESRQGDGYRLNPKIEILQEN